MVQVKFYEEVNDTLLEFAVIMAKKDGKWIFCKHRERNTIEIPGGHREKNETILEAAKRELYEETGATSFDIQKVSIYSVTSNGKETFGMLFLAEVYELEKELHNEIEKIFFGEQNGMKWTYPDIQPILFRRINSL